MGERYGHKTLIDGSHVPLTKDEAEAIWKAVEAAQEKRAADMPTAEDALLALIQAKQRLNELGWWQGGSLRVRPGDECAVAEFGSTGIWRGWVDADGKYVQYGDSVTDRRKAWLKPLVDLTDDERRHMEECDKREAEAHAAYLKRYASWEASNG
jgi:hypothetical protein